MAYDPGAAYRVSSGFRPPNRPNHHGIDFAGPAGTPIPAAAQGTVWYSSAHPGGFGNLVILRHIGQDGSRFYTLYAHQDGRDMPLVGAAVAAGDVIGRCGSTGDSSGPHVHFEIIDGALRLSHQGPLGATGERGRIDPQLFKNWPAVSSTTSHAPTNVAVKRSTAGQAGKAATGTRSTRRRTPK